MFASLIIAATMAATPYPTMAPLRAYLMSSAAEIALARSAAPASVSKAAQVLVLTPSGYKVAVKGTNGFVCMVERSWANDTSSAEFWNPKVRSPNCFNAPAVRTFLPIDLMKTELVLAGKTPQQIGVALASAFDSRTLAPIAPGAMCYMMSPQQYLNDDGKRWHPHVMIFMPGTTPASWGENLTASPVVAAHDAQERLTIFMIPVTRWSDGTLAPPFPSHYHMTM
ncbi:MAG TPA: hypothetical protein VMA98_07105 [Candidatus Acidoferrales bacterium]|nr:hypothetical protein [Candidatus Acidoferrales bacterium]